MQHHHHHWHSSALSREMHLEVFGHAGARVLVFPTTMGSCYEWRDRHMQEVLADYLEGGAIQLVCIDHVHDESWYNKQMHPGARAWRHLQYDHYLLTELLPFTEHLNPSPFVVAMGASFGAYHAACFAFRHPERVNRMIGLSGLYDIKQMTGGYSDENVYASNPFDFMRYEHDPARLGAFTRQDIVFAVGRDDSSYQNNADFSDMLWGKGIGNALRVWDGWAHDWPYWEKMSRLYLGGHD
ncbi:MAG: alpha/beta hydrolase-fold protein [Gemmatimonadota bacterium]